MVDEINSNHHAVTDRNYISINNEWQCWHRRQTTIAFMLQYCLLEYFN